jgi:ketosteroid isomerase-like protein
VKAAYEAYEAYESGLVDFELHAAILHPEIEWQTNWPGLAPAVHGVEGVRRWVEAFLDPWEWVRSEVRELVEVNDETVFLWNHVRARGKESGIEMEMEIFDVLTFRDGQIVLRRTWPARAPAAAAAGLT